MSVAVKVQLLGHARVQRVLQTLSRLQSKDLWDQIGNAAANQARRRITHDKRAPDGSAWPRLSKPYARWKAKRKPGVGMLEFDGNLRDSITHIARDREAEVGSNLPYAVVHQMGSRDRTTPARPFLGMSRQDASDIHDVVRTWIRRRLGITI